MLFSRKYNTVELLCFTPADKKKGDNTWLDFLEQMGLEV